MALTRLQKRLRQEAEEIAEMAQVDYWNVERDWEETEWRTTAFRIAIAHLVTAEVITQYSVGADHDDFSQEHIIPQFMGGSGECATAVTNDVCKKCNSIFGRFVEAPVARGYFLRSIEQQAWAGCFDYNANEGNIYPLTYFGKSQEIQFGADEEIEVWLGPDGGTAWHVHAKQSDDFNALAGGDPVLRRKDQTSRVYSFNASEHPYWILSNLKSVASHFTEEPIFLGADSDIEPTLSSLRQNGKFCRKDRAAIEERDRIRALIDERRPLNHAIQMDLLFDVRFLAKMALAFGYKLARSEFNELHYTERLRRLLWTRRANLDAVEHQVRMQRYFAGLQDVSFKPIIFPHGFVFILKNFKEELILSIVFPSGHRVQVSITDGTVDANADELVRDVQDHVLVSVPQLKRVLGSVSLDQYVAWKLGSYKIPELDGIVGRITERTAMPPLR